MDRLITTVTTIFKERYGANLSIEKDFRSTEAQPVFLEHWQSPFVYSRTLREVKFPIFNSKSQLQAIATVRPVENKDAVVFGEMAELLQATVAEHFELSDKESLLRGQEDAIGRAQAQPEKVVQLRTRKKSEPQVTYKQWKPNREADLEPVWIECDDVNLCSQIGFSVHDYISHWAFINASEIPDLIWEDTEHWKQFPEMTLFIPNIESLSQEQLLKLQMNLEKIKNMGKKRPQIIVTSKSLKDRPDLERLKGLFKFYKAHENLSARVQAHFLLFHFEKENQWTYRCKETDQVFFFPFSTNNPGLH